MRVLLLLVALLVVPVAAAQVPPIPPEQGGGVTIEVTDSQVEVSSERPTTFSATVSHGGPASGSPLDDFGSGAVTISVAGTPTGWTVSADPSQFQLALGASQDVQFKVTVSSEGDGGAATLTITAEFTSPDPLGVFIPDSEASTDVTATRNEDVTRRVLEAIGSGVWILIGALAVAILVAIYLYADARRTVVRLSLVGDEPHVVPGATASIPFLIENVGKEEGHFTMQASTGDAEWEAVVPLTGIDLAPGQSETIHVAVSASKKAPKGSRAVVRIVAVPQEAPRRSAMLALSVQAE